MTPYVDQFVSQKEKLMFQEIREIVERLPEIDLGIDKQGKKEIISCHMLARAISSFFPLKVRDGKFMVVYEHSWLVTKAGHVIDVYPVGILGGPILVEGANHWSPSAKMYSKTSRGYCRDMFSNRQFKLSVKRIVKAIKKIRATLRK